MPIDMSRRSFLLGAAGILGMVGFKAAGCGGAQRPIRDPGFSIRRNAWLVTVKVDPSRVKTVHLFPAGRYSEEIPAVNISRNGTFSYELRDQRIKLDVSVEYSDGSVFETFGPY